MDYTTFSINPVFGQMTYDPTSFSLKIYDGTQWLDCGGDDGYLITLFEGLVEKESFTVDSFFNIKKNGVYRSINIKNGKQLWFNVYDDGTKLVGIYNLDEIKKHLALADEELTFFVLKYGGDLV